jgi:predicted negative regulator of RcsB-dependent stress response
MIPPELVNKRSTAEKSASCYYTMPIKSVKAKKKFSGRQINKFSEKFSMFTKGTYFSVKIINNESGKYATEE